MAAPAHVRHLLEKLHGVKRSGAGWVARCPAHDDNRASLSIGVGDNGGTLVHCHAGCAHEAIVGAAGLTMADLFEKAAAPSANGSTRGRGEQVATYDYVDERGELLFQAVRYAFPKGFAQRSPDGRGGWRWGLNGARRVLYRLPEVLEAVALEKPIYLVEGEKDADRLNTLGLTATTNPMGAGKWLQEYGGSLAGARVVILPDNDDPGRAHAHLVARELAGIATDVRIVELPALPPKGDVSDWLDAGRSREDLEALVTRGPATDTAVPTFMLLRDLVTRPELLQPPECVVPRLAFRARGVATCAQDKAGKSTLLAHAVTAVTTGRSFLGEPVGARHRRAVWVGLEEALGDAVRRFNDLGADLDGVQILVIQRPDVLDELRALLTSWPADLVVLDSLQECARVTRGEAPADGDNAGWGAVIRPWIAAAREHDIALSILHHMTKGPDGVYRGATEIAAAVDALLEMKQPPGSGEDPRVRRLIGRGRWSVEPFSVALRDGRYELDGGAELSMDARVLLHIEANPGASLTALREAIGGRGIKVDAALSQLVARGAVVKRGTGHFSTSIAPVLEGI